LAPHSRFFFRTTVPLEFGIRRRLPGKHRSRVSPASFGTVDLNSDATLAVAGGEAFGSRLWKLPTEVAGNADDVGMRIEALTGLKRNARGNNQAWSPPAR
jgi:hypothetical protein